MKNPTLQSRHIRTSQRQRWADDFKALSEDFASLLAKYELSVGAWNPQSMNRLMDNPERLQQAIENLSRRFDDYLSATQENISPLEESRILWRLLHAEGFTFSDDLFPKLTDDQVVEIYLPDLTQFFANSVFLQNCTYDLSDLYAYEWPELFARPEWATREILVQSQRALTTPYNKRKTLDFQVKPHIGREIFSAEKRELLIHMNFVSPLYDSQRENAGIVATFTPARVTSVSRHDC
jgi:hypothetical protein